MTPLPSTNTGAQIAFYVTIGAFVLLEQRTRLRSMLNRHGSRSDQGSLLVVIASIATGIVAAFLLASDVPAAAITPARWVVFAAGLVLMWAGIALRQWAITLLGRFFTVDVRVQPDQTVVDRGPYRYVRHPSYSGMIVTFLRRVLLEIRPQRLLRSCKTSRWARLSMSQSTWGQPGAKVWIAAPLATPSPLNWRSWRRAWKSHRPLEGQPRDVGHTPTDGACPTAPCAPGRRLPAAGRSRQTRLVVVRYQQRLLATGDTTFTHLL